MRPAGRTKTVSEETQFYRAGAPLFKNPRFVFLPILQLRVL
jgi:hypothetical protein